MLSPANVILILPSQLKSIIPLISGQPVALAGRTGKSAIRRVAQMRRGIFEMSLCMVMSEFCLAN
jgi:hypothetical protein